MTAVDEAIAKAGTQRALAISLGVQQPVIAHWKRKGWVPVKRAIQISEIYGIPWATLVRPELRAVL
jgi:hypothetical protein